MTQPFQSWRRYDADRQAMIRAELDRIAAVDGVTLDGTGLRRIYVDGKLAGIDTTTAMTKSGTAKIASVDRNAEAGSALENSCAAMYVANVA